MPPDAADALDHRFVQAGGLRFHVALAGPADGPLLVLLHGFPEFWYSWRRQIGPLAAAGWRVAVPDQRGYNLSDKPRGRGAYRIDTLADDVIAIAEGLGHRRFALAGHDWGGVVAWHLAGRNPERVRRAMVFNAPHPATLFRYAMTHPSQLRRSWYIGFFQLPWLPERGLAADGFRTMARALAGGRRKRDAFSEADIDRYRAAWAQPGALTAMLNWYRAMPLSRGAAARAGRVTVPLELVWGDRDVALEPGLAEAGIALCDRGRVHHIPNATHWVQNDAPDEVNARMLAFFGPAAQATRDDGPASGPSPTIPAFQPSV